MTRFAQTAPAPGAGTRRSTTGCAPRRTRLPQWVAAIALVACSATADAATFQCIVALPGYYNDAVSVEAPRADLAGCLAIKEAMSQQRCRQEGGSSKCVEQVLAQNCPPESVYGRAVKCVEQTSKPAAPQAGSAGPAAAPVADAAPLGLPSAAPISFICQPDGAPLGSQERSIEASSIDELERKARQQIGPAFRSAQANCMTVQQRQVEGSRRAGQRRVEEAQAQERAAVPGTVAACHKARSTCAARCAAGMSTGQLVGAAATACGDDCVQATQQCLRQAR